MRIPSECEDTELARPCASKPPGGLGKEQGEHAGSEEKGERREERQVSRRIEGQVHKRKEQNSQRRDREVIQVSAINERSVFFQICFESPDLS